jgi:argininosuccinate lyase
MINLSKIAEDLILWSTTEFGFIELSDLHSSSSSAMPQKKNPDPLELTRSKASLVIGDLVSMLSLVKSLPSGYSRDLQDLKPPLFDASSNALKTVRIVREVINSLSVNRDRMLEAANKSYANSLDLAEQLVIRKGIPFRVAHKIVGSLVKSALHQGGIPLNELSSVEIRRALNSVKQTRDGDRDEDVVTLVRRMSPKISLSERKTMGSPNPMEEDRSIAVGMQEASRRLKELKARKKALQYSLSRLSSLVNRYSTS